MEAAWRDQALTVYIATKLNRSHLVHGRASYLLPCLARSEEDMQASGRQAVSIEDSFSHIYGSIGRRAPASEHLLSELAIVAGMAKATLPAHPKWRWDEWTGDYAHRPRSDRRDLSRGVSRLQCAHVPARRLLSRQCGPRAHLEDRERQGRRSPPRMSCRRSASATRRGAIT